MATRKKVIAFQGELVLQSVHNNVDIIRLQEWEAGAGIGQLSFTTLSFRTELQSPIGFDLTVHRQTQLAFLHRIFLLFAFSVTN